MHGDVPIGLAAFLCQRLRIWPVSDKCYTAFCVRPFQGWGFPVCVQSISEYVVPELVASGA